MIAVPIVRDGRVTLALGARVRSDSLGAILRQQQAPPNGAVALVDADHRIVARTKQEEHYVGTKVSAGVHRSDRRACRGELADRHARRARRCTRRSAVRRSPG